MKAYQTDLLFVYSFLIITGITAGEFLNLPTSYFTQKSNFLNQIFVKRGWAWTFILLILLNSKRSYKKLFSATVYWFLITQWAFGPSVLDRIYQFSGSCSLLHLKTLTECFASGGEWDGLDISGHVFLLLHSSLLIWEELLQSEFKNGLNLISGMLCLLLLILWMVMLIVTVLYYHSITEKILGTILGFGFWSIYSLK